MLVYPPFDSICKQCQVRHFKGVVSFRLLRTCVVARAGEDIGESVVLNNLLPFSGEVSCLLYDLVLCQLVQLEYRGTGRRCITKS